MKPINIYLAGFLNDMVLKMPYFTCNVDFYATDKLRHSIESRVL